jgi:transcription elongation factor Elf1
MAITAPKPNYVSMTVACTHCGAKQAVHIAVRTGFAQMSSQTILCVKCKKDFDVMVPDKIVDGPFST